MSEETPVVNPMEMVVTTNSAPVEQRSTEMVTTEPKTPIDDTPEAPEPVAELAPEETLEEKANKSALKAFEAEARADAAERQLKELQPKAKPLGDRPKIEDHDTLENYDKAVDEYHEAKGEARFNEKLTAKQKEDELFRIRADISAKENESRAKHTDFDQVVMPIVGVVGSIPILKDFIAKNPMGTEIVYELGKNPAILAQLRNSDNWAAGEMLINMAARLKKPVVAEVSNAPEPIKPVGSREVVKPRLAQLATKDINGYMALRRKQELAKRRAN